MTNNVTTVVACLAQASAELHLQRVPLHPVEQKQEQCTVLVTGATGFVAGTLVERLLLSGHVVHATVRDPDNEKNVAHLKAMPGAAERLKLFRADLLQPGSYNEAMAGCSHVFHTASPFLNTVAPGEVQARLLDPAVKGTENVLASANATPSVVRVVLTSSIAAIMEPTKMTDDHTFTEEDWPVSWSETVVPYSYSKVLAERRAWEMAKEQSRWQLVVVNPGLVMGPPVSPRSDGESINIMKKMCMGMFFPAAPSLAIGVVDTRDGAAMHCLAAFTPAAAGRYITVGGVCKMREMTQALSRARPRAPWPALFEAPTKLIALVAPFVGLSREAVRLMFDKPLHMSSSKAEGELGMRWTPLEDTLGDMADAMKAHGLIRRP